MIRKLIVFGGRPDLHAYMREAADSDGRVYCPADRVERDDAVEVLVVADALEQQPDRLYGLELDEADLSRTPWLSQRLRVEIARRIKNPSRTKVGRVVDRELDGPGGPRPKSLK